MTSVGEDYPKEQARMRELLEQAREIAKLPNVNMVFYIAQLNQIMTEADAAAMSQDPVRVLKAYKAMKEVER